MHILAQQQSRCIILSSVRIGGEFLSCFLPYLSYFSPKHQIWSVFESCLFPTVFCCFYWIFYKNAVDYNRKDSNKRSNRGLSSRWTKLFEIVFAISNPQFQKLLCRNDFSISRFLLLGRFLSIFLSWCKTFYSGEKILLWHWWLCRKILLM